MGNKSSAESRAASADKVETSGASGSPKRKVSSSAFRSRSVEAEQLCRALRDKGLCISESDMKKVLAKHTNIMDALTYAIASGMTRKLAKTQRCQVTRTPSSSGGGGSGGGGGRNRPQENMRPPLAPSLSATSSKKVKVNQKRSRSGESETSSAQQMPTMMAGSRGERPSKRPAVMRGSFFGGVGVAEGPRARAKATKRSPKGAGQRGDTDSTDRADSAGGGVRMDDDEDDDDDDTGGVLTVLQQGSPPRQRLGRPRDALALKLYDKASSAAAMAADKPDAGFAQLPKKLNMGTIDVDMLKAMERWGERSPDQKEAAVREVIKGLRLNGLGMERQERLDEELVHCLRAAMEDLSQSTNFQNGVLTICRKVREARQIGHDMAVTVSGLYRSLYGGGGSGTDRSRSNSSGIQMVDGQDETDDYDGSPPPTDPRLRARPPSPGSTPTALGYPYRTPSLSSTEPYYNGPPSPSDSATAGSARDGGRSSQRPGQQQPNRRFVFHSPSNGSRGGGAALTPCQTAGPMFGSISPRRASPPRRPPQPTPSRWKEAEGGRAAAAAPGETQPEEKALESACDVCKAAVKRTIRSRNEEEWLTAELDKVEKKKAELRRVDDADLAGYQEKVDTTAVQVEDAKEKLEEAVKNTITPHMDTNNVEEALRSLLNSQSQSGGCDPLGPRHQARTVLKEAEDRLKMHGTRLMLIQHATAINKILFEEMFGDLVDRISSVQQQALKRMVACQRNLKSAARELLEKFKGNVQFQIQRKTYALERLAVIQTKLDHDARFFGKNSNEYRTAMSSFQEVKGAVEDSGMKMGIIYGGLKETYSGLMAELPQEDFLNLEHDTKVFLAARNLSEETGEPEEHPPMR